MGRRIYRIRSIMVGGVVVGGFVVLRTCSSWLHEASSWKSRELGLDHNSHGLLHSHRFFQLDPTSKRFHNLPNRSTSWELRALIHKSVGDILHLNHNYN